MECIKNLWHFFVFAFSYAYSQLPSLETLESMQLHLSAYQKQSIDSVLTIFRKELSIQSLPEDIFYKKVDSLSSEFEVYLRRVLSPQQWQIYQRELESMRVAPYPSSSH